MSEELSEFDWKLRVKDLELRAYINRKLGRKKICAFLDFDGVINVMYPAGAPQYERLVKQIAEDMNFADSEVVRRFSRLCLDYDMEVVITSSWRYSGLEYCRDYLIHAGMDTRVKIVGMTDDEFSSSREMKITDYLFAHPGYGEFLIFDDIDMKHLSAHQMLCKPDSGYTEALDQRARKILESKGYYPRG